MQTDKTKGIIKVVKWDKNKCLILCKLGFKQVDVATQEKKNLAK